MISMLNFLDILDNQKPVFTRELSSMQDYLSEKSEELLNGIGIVHFNIRSLKKHYEELLVYLESGKKIMDIIVLSETRQIEVITKNQITQHGIITHT